jgi:hypothetical protein
MFADPWFFDRVDNNIVDIDGKYYSMILKNGTTSVESKLGDRGVPLRDTWYEKYGNENRLEEPFVVNVILRDPVARYFSALDTVKKITGHYDTGMGKTMDTQERMTSSGNAGWYLDPHMFPQYWWLVNAYISTNCSPDLHFRFVSIDELDKILGNITRKNTSPRSYVKTSTASQRSIIKQRYNIDLQTWNNMLNKTMNYEQWVEEISLNIRTYFKDIKQTFPRYQRFYDQTNPMKNVDNFDIILKNFNETLEKIEEIAKNSKI